MKALRIFSVFFLVILNIGCDQVSKSVVRDKVESYSITEIMGDKVILTKVENTGAMLSMGSDLSPVLKNILLQGLPIIALSICFIILLVKTKLNFLTVLGLTAIVGGGIGNIYDRILYGSVTDFLQIDFVLFKTGVFNMADVSISFGILLLLIQSLFSKD